jgi:hypothetical protein
MDTKSQLVLKRTLANLRRIGPSGARKADILDLAEMDCGIMTTAEKDALWELLEGRRYVAGHWEPVTNAERWTLTERGLTALEGL